MKSFERTSIHLDEQTIDVSRHTYNVRYRCQLSSMNKRYSLLRSLFILLMDTFEFVHCVMFSCFKVDKETIEIERNTIVDAKH
jgi:hypothetical protein